MDCHLSPITDIFDKKIIPTSGLSAYEYLNLSNEFNTYLGSTNLIKSASSPSILMFLGIVNSDKEYNLIMCKLLETKKKRLVLDYFKIY